VLIFVISPSYYSKGRVRIGLSSPPLQAGISRWIKTKITEEEKASSSVGKRLPHNPLEKTKTQKDTKRQKKIKKSKITRRLSLRVVTPAIFKPLLACL